MALTQQIASALPPHARGAHRRHSADSRWFRPRL